MVPALSQPLYTIKHQASRAENIAHCFGRRHDAYDKKANASTVMSSETTLRHVFAFTWLNSRGFRLLLLFQILKAQVAQITRRSARALQSRALAMSCVRCCSRPLSCWTISCTRMLCLKDMLSACISWRSPTTRADYLICVSKFAKTVRPRLRSGTHRHQVTQLPLVSTSSPLAGLVKADLWL